MNVVDSLRTGVDRALEFSVAGSFTKLGPAGRSRLFAWGAFHAGQMDGKLAVVTGATSGLGLESATQLARMGGQVVLLARDAERGRRVCADIVASTGNPNVSVVVADMGDLVAVRRAARAMSALPHIDVLIHNAGTLSATRKVSAQGVEQTVAAQLVGPFLLTHLLARQLTARTSRVIWVTSGGMYTEPLSVDSLEMTDADYNGVTAYARAKRAQVSLVEFWAPRLLQVGVTMVAMHPGWADTPGLRAALPTFRRVVAPLLRSPAEGADTILWLASGPFASIPAGSFWLDRGQRSPHRSQRTRQSDTAAEQGRLWSFCLDRSGITPEAAAAFS
mgnify:CR=1 FL=1